jgi:hypothetical protein
MYKIIKPLPDLKIRNIKSINLNKNIFSIIKTNNLFSGKYLPLTTNLSYFGYLLEGKVRNSYINQLIKVILQSNTQIPEILSKIKLDKNVKIFLYKECLREKDSNKKKLFNNT